MDRLYLLIGFALVARRELFIRQRGLDQYGQVDLHAATEIGLVFATCLLILIAGRLTTLLQRIRNCSIGVYALLLFVSACTSPLSNNFFYSAFFSVENLTQVLLIFEIVSRSKNRDDLVRRVLLCCLVITIISVSFKFWLFGFEGNLFSYKSNGGAACACISTVFSFSLIWGGKISNNRSLALYTFFICGAGVVITTSAASIISTFFGLSIASLILGKGKFPLIMLLLFLVGFFAFNPTTALSVLFPGKEVQNIVSLHGRFGFWDDTLVLFQQRPFFGYGYAMSAKVGHLGGANLHNATLSILLGSGGVGIILFFTGLLILFRESIAGLARHTSIVAPAIAAFCAGLLNSNSISIFGEDWRGAGFLFFLMWATIGLLSKSAYHPQLPPASSFKS
jgi:hypothetical protein